MREIYWEECCEERDEREEIGNKLLNDWLDASKLETILEEEILHTI